MQYVKFVKPQRAEKITRGERWAANCLECFNMAKAFSWCLEGVDDKGQIDREGSRQFLERWEKALSGLPHDEAMAARLIYCERLDAGEAADVMGISRIKAAGLAGRACKRLSEMFNKK